MGCASAQKAAVLKWGFPVESHSMEAFVRLDCFSEKLEAELGLPMVRLRVAEKLSGLAAGVNASG